VFSDAMVAKGPIQMGPVASTNRPPACPKYTRQFLTQPARRRAPLRPRSSCAMENVRRSVQSPSLRSVSGRTGLYSAFSNPVLERSGLGMANMGSFRAMRADRDNVSLLLVRNLNLGGA
jgi:hypothetical protein